jgi:hypothetical protein
MPGHRKSTRAYRGTELAACAVARCQERDFWRALGPTTTSETLRHRQPISLKPSRCASDALRRRRNIQRPRHAATTCPRRPTEEHVMPLGQAGHDDRPLEAQALANLGAATRATRE